MPELVIILNCFDYTMVLKPMKGGKELHWFSVLLHQNIAYWSCGSCDIFSLLLKLIIFCNEIK